jgi:hypothetical protein
MVDLSDTQPHAETTQPSIPGGGEIDSMSEPTTRPHYRLAAQRTKDKQRQRHGLSQLL